MNYLADTHILLWSFIEPQKLSKRITSILLDESNVIYYSPISLWEISIKYKLKKLTLKGGTPEDFFYELNNSYYHCKTINPIDMATNYKLPLRHGDPFDRFLIWEAIRSNFIFLSSDKNAKSYKEDGLNCIRQ